MSIESISEGLALPSSFSRALSQVTAHIILIQKWVKCLKYEHFWSESEQIIICFCLFWLIQFLKKIIEENLLISDPYQKQVTFLTICFLPSSLFFFFDHWSVCSHDIETISQLKWHTEKKFCRFHFQISILEFFD